MPIARVSDKLKFVEHYFMRISDFDYELPEDLIAQEPAANRDSARMLVVDRAKRSWSDSDFLTFPQHLQPTDVVVINNTRVIPARLTGQRQESGGRVEIFLVRELRSEVWETLIRPGSRLRKGAMVMFGDAPLSAEILDDPGKELRQVRFHCQGSFDNVLGEIGSTPLPPYIKRPSGASTADRERYQTIYSKHRGAIAAPTDGLHFTPTVLSATSRRAHLAEITLHVGYGTFEPVRVDDITNHSVTAERFNIPSAAALAINEARNNGGRVIAIGTTTVRALESAAMECGEVVAADGETNLTITPG